MVCTKIHSKNVKVCDQPRKIAINLPKGLNREDHPPPIRHYVIYEQPLTSKKLRKPGLPVSECMCTRLKSKNKLECILEVWSFLWCGLSSGKRHGRHKNSWNHPWAAFDHKIARRSCRMLAREISRVWMSKCFHKTREVRFERIVDVNPGKRTLPGNFQRNNS